MQFIHRFLFLLLALIAVAKHGEGETDDDPDPSPVQVPPASSSFSASTSTAISQTTIASSTISQATSTQSSVQSVASTTSTSSSTASTANPTTPSAVQFTPPSNLTTCEEANFTWIFLANQSMPVTIEVTNGLITRTLSTTVQAMLCRVSWPSVDVPPGPYRVVAFDTSRTAGLFAQSSTFFVNSGNDTSCVNPNSGTAIDTGSSPSITPVTKGSSTKTLSSGALAGTVTAVIVSIGGLLAAFTLPKACRRAFRKQSPPRPGAPYHLF